MLKKTVVLRSNNFSMKTIFSLVVLAFILCVPSFAQEKRVDSTKTYLTPSDLNVISTMVLNENEQYYENLTRLKRFVKIELVSKKEYEATKKTAVNYITDTDKIKKKKGVIALKCLKKTVKFVDKPYNEEDRCEYTYVGQINFLNQYIIGGMYWETLDYKLVDKTSGKTTIALGSYPHVSNDKKHIICLFANPYETTADLDLYTIQNGKIKLVVSVSFKNWMNTLEDNKTFWSQDGYLYCSVNHINSYWKKDGNINNRCQYIRIKVL
jgi:hypothetical protein